MSAPWASLAMYAPDTARPAWEELWTAVGTALAAEGVAAPELTWGARALEWHRPGLFLSHTCGRPLALGRAGDAHVVGAFDFGLEGCAPGLYRSALLRGPSAPARAALNGWESQSGARVLHAWPGVPLDDPLVTGAHLASVAALEEGLAGWAAVDAHTLALWQAEGGKLRQARIVGWSAPTPAPPLVTHDAALVEPLRRAVATALRAAPQAAARLRLRGFLPRTRADYDMFA